MNTRYSSFRLASFHRPYSSFDIRLTLAGILILSLFPSNGRGAKVVSQEDLTSLPPGRPTIVYVQDFKIERQSTAAKFVVSRRDLPKNIRQTAQTVADQIVRHAK